MPALRGGFASTPTTERSIEDAHVPSGSSFAAGVHRHLRSAEPMTLLWRVWNAREIHGSGFRGNLGTLLRVVVYAVGVVVIPAAAFAAAFALLWLLIFVNSLTPYPS